RFPATRSYRQPGQRGAADSTRRKRNRIGAREDVVADADQRHGQDDAAGPCAMAKTIPAARCAKIKRLAAVKRGRCSSATPTSIASGQ
ncbi:Hypothetical protein FKW44_004883, partial [Caligus rogercresseyi]